MKVPGGVTEGLTFDAVGPLQHFCKALSHRVCCYRVLSELKNLVKVPYLHLFTHRHGIAVFLHGTSILIFLRLLHKEGKQTHKNGVLCKKKQKKERKRQRKKAKLQFCSKILLQDENLSIQAEGKPNVGSLFKGSPTGVCVKSEYNCGLSDLASMLLHQVVSQLIYWLHEEALAVGMKV